MTARNGRLCALRAGLRAAGIPIFIRRCWRCGSRIRNAGLGRQIKLFQREDALARGFELIEWTFDPLEIKNAYLNIEKLGAIARRYTVNQYGITSSPLQGGLPTRPPGGRVVAEVEAGGNFAAHGEKAAEFETAEHNFGSRCRFTIGRPRRLRGSGRKKSRIATENNFLQAFADGLAVLGYERDQQGGGKFLLGRWEEKWMYPAT